MCVHILHPFGFNILPFRLPYFPYCFLLGIIGIIRALIIARTAAVNAAKGIVKWSRGSIQTAGSKVILQSEAVNLSCEASMI